MNNDDEDLSSIDSLLESIDDKKKQKTPSKSHIKTRKVNVNNLHNVGFSNDSDKKKSSRKTKNIKSGQISEIWPLFCADFVQIKK